MIERFDHVVIGAGIVGSAAARSLAETGASVVLVERFARGHDRGSSHGASRIFRQGYTADDYVSLTGRALEAWRRLEAETARPILTLTGAVDHGEPGMIAAIEAAMTAAGIPNERLDPLEAADRWPGLRFESAVLHHASAGRIASAEGIEALLDLAVAHGAELRFDTGVEKIVVGGSTAEVHTSGGILLADSVVVAAGSWAEGLVGDIVADAGFALPAITVTQEQPAHFRSLVPESSWPSFVHYPSDPALRFASSYGLFTPGEGVKVGAHDTGVVVDPDVRDFLPEPVRFQKLLDYVTEWVPGVDPASAVPISCLYDSTQNEDFVLDRVGPVTIATGFSGHGFKFGPTLGEILAGLAAGQPAVERFRLAR